MRLRDEIGQSVKYEEYYGENKSDVIIRDIALSKCKEWDTIWSSLDKKDDTTMLFKNYNPSLFRKMKERVISSKAKYTKEILKTLYSSRDPTTAFSLYQIKTF